MAWHRQEAGQLQEALGICRQALAKAPRVPRAHFALATVYEDLGRPDQAAACYRAALKLDPAYFEARLNLGACQEALGDAAAAEQSYRRAAAVRPDSPICWYNLGHALAAQGKHSSAVLTFERSLGLAPDLALAHYSLGNSLWELGRVDDAAERWRAALALRPDDGNAWMNLAVALKVQGKIDEAIAAFDHCLRLAPDDAALRRQRAMALLLDGRWDEGWAEFEWRWQDPGFPSPRRDYDRPLWDGGPLDGRRILLHWEQGLGDTIQFIRYAALVKARGATVVAELQPRLCRLLRGVEGLDALVPSGEPLSPFDCHAPLMSLPRLLGIGPAEIPAPAAYLWPEPARVEAWRTRIGVLSGLRVGLCWEGRKRHPDDRFRSIPPRELGLLLALPNISWIGLQQDDRAAALAETTSGNRVVSFAAETDEERDAFVDTAAIVYQLDLVVTVDTAIAHLAGALGTPTWLLLHAGPDWRWLKAGDRTPWYPGMRLFRQRTLGDWAGVLREVEQALARETSDRMAPGRDQPVDRGS